MAAPAVQPLHSDHPFLRHANCHACPLYDPKRPPVCGSGPRTAPLVVVGDAITRSELVAKRPFVGASGHLLDQTLSACGIERTGVWVTTCVACRAVDQWGDDVPPPREAVEACRPRLLAELKAVNPNLILSVGASAAKSLLRTRQGITEIQGVVEHRPDLPAPVLPTFHPAAALKKGDGEDIFDDILSAFGRAVKIATGELVLPPRDEIIPWKYATAAAQVVPILKSLLTGDGGFHLSIDVETEGLDIVSHQLLQVVIGNDNRSAVFEYPAIQHGEARRLMLDLLRDERFTWYIHNSSFDLQWLAREFDGVEPTNVVDTICLAMGTTERSTKTGLKRLARDWLNAPYYEEEVHKYLNVDGSGWGNVPRPILAKYAAKDAVYTSRMHPILEALCEEEGTRDLAYNLLMPAQRMFAQVERAGVRVDLSYLDALEAEWVPRVEEARKAVQDYVSEQGWFHEVPFKEKVKREVPITKTRTYKRTGQTVSTTKMELRTFWDDKVRLEPINPGSSTQLAKFLFDHLKLRPPGGERKTGKEFRDAYPRHPITALLEEYGLAQKILGTYVRGLADDVRADGRAHPSFHINAARTGRLSMTKPPLQVIPRDKEDDNLDKYDSIKRMFLPDEGDVWVSTDFSQLEVRVGWMLSGDEEMGKLVLAADYHKAMASKIFGIPIEQVTKEQRHKAKTTNFLVQYGGSAYALSLTLGISVESAEVLVDGFFNAVPKYKEYYFGLRRQALEEGRISTLFGRVRRWPLITAENKNGVMNQACNFPVQSTASDMNLLAAIRLQKVLRERGWGRVLFLVHDSIEFTIRKGREAEAIALIKQVMETPPIETDVVFETEVKVGSSWGDCKVWQA